jgi:hypothetical protein
MYTFSLYLSNSLISNVGRESLINCDIIELLYHRNQKTKATAAVAYYESVEEDTHQKQTDQFSCSFKLFYSSFLHLNQKFFNYIWTILIIYLSRLPYFQQKNIGKSIIIKVDVSFRKNTLF